MASILAGTPEIALALSATIYNFAIQLSDVDRGVYQALAVRDLTGELRAWIDIGAPDAARLHKAAKAAPRVAVYTHKAPAALLRSLAGERIHRAETIELYAFDRELIDGLVARLQRRMAFDLSVTDAHLFISIEDGTLSGDVERLAITSEA